MKSVSCIILMCLSVSFMFAQHNNVTDTITKKQRLHSKLLKAAYKRDFKTALNFSDSLVNLGKKNKDDLLIAFGLQNKAEVYRFNKEPDSARHCYNVMLPIFKTHKHHSTLVSVYASLASIAREKGELDSSKYYLQIAKQYVSDSTKKKSMFYYYNQKSILNENKARLDSSIYYVFKRIAITDSANHYALNNAYSRLAELFYNVADTTKSLLYIHKSLNEISKSKRPLEISELKTLMIKLKVLLKQKRREEAILLTDKIIQKASKKERSDFIVGAKTLISKSNFNNATIKTDRLVLHDSIIKGKKLSPSVFTRFYLTQLNQNLKLKNYAKAQQILKILDTDVFNVQGIEIKKEYYNLSSKYYDEVGNYKKSLEANKNYQNVVNEINNRQKVYDVYALEAKYNITKKDKELAEKQLEIKDKETELEKKKAQNAIFTGLSAVLLIGSVLSWFLYKQRQKRIQQELLTVKREQQVKTLESLMEGEENERLRIAKELHDGINVDLSTIKYKLSSLLEKNDEVINETVAMIDKSCQQVRAISHNLVPPSLKNFSLVEAIEDYCTTMNSIYHPKISFYKLGDNFNLSQKAEINIFRIIQELVNNSIKHADATEVDVQISYRNNNLQLTIEDNGIGFNTNNTNGHGIGLKSVRSRVTYLSGKLDLNSNEKGTSYTIDINTKKI